MKPSNEKRNNNIMLLFGWGMIVATTWSPEYFHGGVLLLGVIIVQAASFAQGKQHQRDDDGPDVLKMLRDKPRG